METYIHMYKYIWSWSGRRRSRLCEHWFRRRRRGVVCEPRSGRRRLTLQRVGYVYRRKLYIPNGFSFFILAHTRLIILILRYTRHLDFVATSVPFGWPTARNRRLNARRSSGDSSITSCIFSILCFVSCWSFFRSVRKRNRWSNPLERLRDVVAWCVIDFGLDLGLTFDVFGILLSFACATF